MQRLKFLAPSRLCSTFIFLLVIILASCKNKNEAVSVLDENAIVFKNSFEELAGWTENISLDTGDAHSGHYFVKADTTNEFSAGYKYQLSKITKRKIKFIEYSAFVCVADLSQKGALVLSIDDGPTNLLWTSVPIDQTSVKIAGKWTNVHEKIKLPPNVNINSTVKVYLWNNKHLGTIRGDDFEVRFIL